jgi:beta-N-acetylhexosaminidase
MMPGQRLILGLPGAALTDPVQSLLKKEHIGGIILFDYNCAGANQLKKSLAQIRRACKIAPFVGLDYEGGRISRLGNILPSLGQPSRYDDNLKELRIDCRKVGDRFGQMGINLNFAPVADLTYKPLNPALKARTFSADPSQTAAYSLSFIEGFADRDIVCCLKHFPGLGSAANDPHKQIAVTCLSIDHLLDYDLVPFKAGINAGVRMIMTTHLLATAIDNKIVTFSSRAIRLARDLGFKGIIITDDLSMGAVKSGVSLPDAVLQALIAGHDMAMICHDYDQYENIIAHLENNIDMLKENGHDQALERIHNVKKSIS